MITTPRTLMLLLALVANLGSQSAPLTFVAAQRQLGPVAYRDPLGVPSPDGRWLATTAGLHLYVRSQYTGPVREVGTGRQRVGSVVWRPDSTRLVAREQDYERTWADWFEYDLGSGASDRLWPERSRLHAADSDLGEVRRDAMQQLAFDAEGAVALVSGASADEVWTLEADGSNARRVAVAEDIDSIARLHDGRIACVAGHARELFADCARRATALAADVYGPMASVADDVLVYASPTEGAALDLWRLDLRTGESRRLTAFARDAYAPYAQPGGRILFKVQDYRTSIAVMAAGGGTAQPVTTFQSETPSWDWAGERLAFTWGDWRRRTDDVHYPDISQHLGIVDLTARLPATQPHEIVRRSYSEDQALHWSPNGRWIALHSHADGTDDVWLQPSDGSAAAHPITEGGNETGWPRWSRDGHWIVYPTDLEIDGRLHLGKLVIVGVDQESGTVNAPQRIVELPGYDGRVNFAEFTPDSRELVFESNDGIGRRGLYRVAIEGGAPQRFHAYDSEQWFSGIGVSPAGDAVVYIAPADDGRFQLFRVPLSGGQATQLTFDDTDKTHPTWSPRGDRIAYTTFTYESHFWTLPVLDRSNTGTR